MFKYHVRVLSNAPPLFFLTAAKVLCCHYPISTYGSIKISILSAHSHNSFQLSNIAQFGSKG